VVPLAGRIPGSRTGVDTGFLSGPGRAGSTDHPGASGRSGYSIGKNQNLHFSYCDRFELRGFLNNIGRPENPPINITHPFPPLYVKPFLGGLFPDKPLHLDYNPFSIQNYSQVHIALLLLMV
jgi:hypothetical protein